MTEQTKLYTLTQDNGARNKGDMEDRKISVQIVGEHLDREIKSYFKWRKDVGYDRLMKQASSKYDSFIAYLHIKGY